MPLSSFKRESDICVIGEVSLLSKDQDRLRIIEDRILQIESMTNFRDHLAFSNRETKAAGDDSPINDL
jgi:hypothetical protein